jgi:hypothetical protein
MQTNATIIAMMMDFKEIFLIFYLNLINIKSILKYLRECHVINQKDKLNKKKIGREKV